MEHSLCSNFSPDLFSFEAEVIDNTKKKQENDVENITKAWSRTRLFLLSTNLCSKRMHWKANYKYKLFGKTEDKACDH